MSDGGLIWQISQNATIIDTQISVWLVLRICGCALPPCHERQVLTDTKNTTPKTAIYQIQQFIKCCLWLFLSKSKLVIKRCCCLGQSCLPKSKIWQKTPQSVKCVDEPFFGRFWGLVIMTKIMQVVLHEWFGGMPLLWSCLGGEPASLKPHKKNHPFGWSRHLSRLCETAKTARLSSLLGRLPFERVSPRFWRRPSLHQCLKAWP